MSRIATKLKLQAFDTHMGVFDFSVRCIIGKYKSGEKYAAHIFEIPDIDMEEVADGLNFGYEARGKCYFRRGYVPILWIPRKPKTPREHATLAHEAIHAINHLFEWSATPLTRDTEEVFAHAVAHLVNNILEKAK